MKNTVKSLKLMSAGTADAFFSRSAARAQELDRGERLLPEMRLTFEYPSALLRVPCLSKPQACDCPASFDGRFTSSPRDPVLHRYPFSFCPEFSP
jgi:hypothetical protein